MRCTGTGDYGVTAVVVVVGCAVCGTSVYLYLTAFGGPEATLQAMWPTLWILPTTWAVALFRNLRAKGQQLVATLLIEAMVCSV